MTEFWNFFQISVHCANLCLIFTPWPLRPNGYCCCLRLSVCPSGQITSKTARWFHSKKNESFTKEYIFSMIDLVIDHSFLPEASFGLRVLSSAVFVGLCVRVCVNHELVRTHRSFKLGSPNLDQR